MLSLLKRKKEAHYFLVQKEDTVAQQEVLSRSVNEKIKYFEGLTDLILPRIYKSKHCNYEDNLFSSNFKYLISNIIKKSEVAQNDLEEFFEDNIEILYFLQKYNCEREKLKYFQNHHDFDGFKYSLSNLISKIMKEGSLL